MDKEYRKELQERFLAVGLESFSPHEVLEFLLSPIAPRNVIPMRRFITSCTISVHSLT